MDSGAGGNSNEGSNRGRARGRGRGGAKGQGKGRGGGGGGQGRRGGKSGGGQQQQQQQAAGPTLPQPDGKASAVLPAADGDGTGDDSVEAEVCFICASPVIHQSVAPCNHRTCHICSLRMRALYKSKECAHCRTLATQVIFTDDGIKRYEDYSDADITSSDTNIGIRYANEEIVGDTVLLLRYNCPDESCDFAGRGWPDLHRHVRSQHHKRMCDICTRNKKVFTHEHELFSDKELERHMRHGDDKPGALEQTGFKGHPLCAFCGLRFYDSDRLYEHCREKHERCFLCDRQDSRQPHYYENYDHLEKHFQEDHFPCLDRECIEKKFVVFATEMDLKAHQLEEHGNSLSKDVRRDARVVDIGGFNYREGYQVNDRRGAGSGRGGGGGRGGREGRDGRGRGRDPNAEPLPPSSAQPLRRDELAFQRQMAIHSSQSVSNRTFGGQLTSEAPTPAAASAASTARSAPRGPARNAPQNGNNSNPPVAEMETMDLTDPNLSQEDRGRLLRHGAVVEHAQNLLGNDQNKMSTFRGHISSYRKGSMSATALIEAFFVLFSDTSSSSLGSLVREVADIYEDKNKAEQLRKAWNDWRAINEDYPTLPGLAGMQGATTSHSGWASAAPNTAASASGTRHTNRVLKLKNSTQQSRRSSNSTQPGGTWASSAATNLPPSSSRTPGPSSFPALPSSSSSSSRQAAGWGTSSIAGGGGGSSSRQPALSSSRPSKPPATGGDNFPALPAAPKPTTTIFGPGMGRAVRRDGFGNASNNNSFSWGGGDSGSGAADAAAADENPDETGGGKGKKGNKGKKKVLVQWG